MARKSRRSLGGIEPVPGSEKNPTGRRFVRLIEDQLRLLREQKSHGNRELFLDHLVIAHLLAFFNPMVTGLRSIDDIFNEPSVRKRYGLRRMPKSTVADAQQVFEPELLLPIIESLRERAGIQPHDKRLDQVTRELLAVDGSFFTVAPRIAWALFNNSGKGTVRLHVQFNIMDGVPDHVTLTDGQTTETSQLFDSLQAGRFYIMDRGFQNYGLFKDILQAGSDFCVRLRKSAHAEDIEDRPLTAEDLAHGVRRDTTVRLGWREGQTARLPPLRIVEIPFADRKGDEQIMRLLTNRLDLPAHLIGVIYQHRWQVELFFRWLKCIAHFETVASIQSLPADLRPSWPTTSLSDDSWRMSPWLGQEGTSSM